MMRAVLAFLAVWGVVFFGLSYIWHTSKTKKFDIVRGLFYSFMTAFIAMAFMTAIVVLF